MYIKFSEKGMRYYSIMATVELMGPDDLLEASIFSMEFPDAYTIEAAAYLISKSFGYDISSEMIEEIDEDYFDYLQEQAEAEEEYE